MFRALAILLSIVLLDYAASRLLPNVHDAWLSARRGTPTLLVSALGLELASIASYSAITHALLPPALRLSYPVVLAIDVIGLGASHVMPGGGASAAALRLRLWARRGLPGPTAVVVGAVEYVIVVMWLIAVLVIGVLLASPSSGTRPPMRAALVVAVVTMLLFCGFLAVLIARPDQIVTMTTSAAAWIPFVKPATLERVARSVATQMRLASTTRDRYPRAALWGLANWILDVASLFLCVSAFGHVPNVGGILATYALVGLLALLPITPGGLGLVEGVAVPTLVSFGVSPTAALLGVLSWRLWAFWVPIPMALMAFAGLATADRTPSRSAGATPTTRR